MDTVEGSSRAAFERDLGSAMRTITSPVTSSFPAGTARSWALWTSFCTDLGVDVFLQDSPDPLAFFLVFAVQYRTGSISKSHQPVRASTVADVLQHSGQAMALMGYTDHHILPLGKYSLRLERLLRSFDREDPAPNRVQPASIDLLNQVFNHAQSAFDTAVAQLCVIGFYFLCRPGETCVPSSPGTHSAPFRLCDVLLHTPTYAAVANVFPLACFPKVCTVTLCFTEQKNGDKGNKVNQHRSGHPILCPVVAVCARVFHLRTHSAPAATPLYVFFDRTLRLPIAAWHLTATLQHAATSLRSHTGVDPACITARSLRPGGATSLLCADIDHDRIKLLGRWKSDAMLRYLHIQAAPAMRHFAPAMLQHGSFTFLRGSALPREAQALLPPAPPPP
ncbi:site-specific integrase [Marinobacter shengliensis]